MSFKFTEENIIRINELITHYPEKRPAVMGVLYIAQEQNGWISYEVMKEDENGYSEYDKLMAANLPLLVFHYGMTLDQVTDIFKQRNVVLRKNEFIEVDAIEF